MFILRTSENSVSHPEVPGETKKKGKVYGINPRSTKVFLAFVTQFFIHCLITV